MAEYLPFIPSDNNYRLVTSLGGIPYLIDVHWNDSDSSWYMDIYESDETPILVGIKVVLGVRLGKRSKHEFFTNHILQAVDTSGARKDAGYDDLGARVQVVHFNLDDFKGKV